MQIDLFQTPGEVREKCGKVRKPCRTSSFAASGTGELRKPHFPFPEVRGSAAAPQSHVASGTRRRSAELEEKDEASQIRDALAERHELQMALADALDVEDAALAEMRPYQQAFDAAHRALEKAWNEPDTTKEDRLNLYTARMEAGHARYPFKVRVDEANGWRKRIESDLRAVNAVLDRLEQARAKLMQGRR